MEPSHISVQQLGVKLADAEILRQLDFTIARGECLAIIGANGSGKTTLLKILCGLLQPTTGNISIDGLSYRLPAQNLQIRRILAYAPDQAPLYANDTVNSYLTFMAQLKGLSKTDYAPRIQNCLELCNLLAVKNSIIATLSKGTQQRINIAQALLAEPRILVLDEPSNALDVDQCQNLKLILQQLKQKGVTIIIATHHYNEIIPICDYMLRISGGNIQKILSPLPNHEFKVNYDPSHNSA